MIKLRCNLRNVVKCYTVEKRRDLSGARCGRAAIRSRPFGATMCEWSKEQLGGASADAQSYWQGRFAACAFVGFSLGVGLTRNSWGVAPNPTRELRPLTPQGGSPLDPSARLSWSLLHTPSACLSVGCFALIPLPFPHPAIFAPFPEIKSPKPGIFCIFIGFHLQIPSLSRIMKQYNLGVVERAA